MMVEGFTRLEVRLEGSTKTIVIPIDWDLLVNTENMIPSLGTLCSNVEGKTLEKLNDATLSKSIDGLALRVCFSTYNFQLPCFVLHSYFLLVLSFF